MYPSCKESNGQKKKKKLGWRLEKCHIHTRPTGCFFLLLVEPFSLRFPSKASGELSENIFSAEETFSAVVCSCFIVKIPSSPNKAVTTAPSTLVPWPSLPAFLHPVAFGSCNTHLTSLFVVNNLYSSLNLITMC